MQNMIINVNEIDGDINNEIIQQNMICISEKYIAVFHTEIRTEKQRQLLNLNYFLMFN